MRLNGYLLSKGLGCTLGMGNGVERILINSLPRYCAYLAKASVGIVLCPG